VCVRERERERGGEKVGMLVQALGKNGRHSKPEKVSCLLRLDC
jgi:hypothetical protein